MYSNVSNSYKTNWNESIYIYIIQYSTLTKQNEISLKELFLLMGQGPYDDTNNDNDKETRFMEFMDDKRDMSKMESFIKEHGLRLVDFLFFLRSKKRKSGRY